MSDSVKRRRRDEYQYIRRIREKTSKLPNDVITKLRRDKVFVSVLGSETTIKAFREAWDNTDDYVKDFLFMKFIEPELDFGSEFHRFTLRKHSRLISHSGLRPYQDLKACIRNGQLVIFNSVTLKQITYNEDTRVVLGKSVLRRGNITAAKRLAEADSPKALKVAVWINEYDKFLTYAAALMNDIARRYHPAYLKELYISGYAYFKGKKLDEDISIEDDIGSPKALRFIRDLELFINQGANYDRFCEKMNLGKEHKKIVQDITRVRDEIKLYHDEAVHDIDSTQLQLDILHKLTLSIMNNLIDTAKELDKTDINEIDLSDIRINARPPIFKHRGLDSHLAKTSVKKLSAVKKRLLTVHKLK